jgi:hypothetical protein
MEDERKTTYSVRTTLTALRYRDGESNLVSIPCGAVITVKGQLEEFGLVEVQHEKETLAVYSRDIAERAERIG